MSDVLYTLTQRHRFFDGTNAPEMLDAVVLVGNTNAYVSGSANYPGSAATLQIRSDTPENGGVMYTFTVGDSFKIAFDGSAGQFDSNVFDVDYTWYFTPLEEFILSVLPATVPTTLAMGYEVTPSLGVGASATVSVPMVPALPDSGYNVAVALAGSAQLLGALAILSATVAGSAQVDVVVQNNGLLTLGGATVLVTALHNG